MASPQHSVLEALDARSHDAGIASLATQDPLEIGSSTGSLTASQARKPQRTAA